jgi:hypothetical protein
VRCFLPLLVKLSIVEYWICLVILTRFVSSRCKGVKVGDGDDAEAMIVE